MEANRKEKAMGIENMTDAELQEVVSRAASRTSVSKTSSRTEAAWAEIRKRAASTAIKVTVYDGIAEGLDTDGGRWQIVCETHGAILSVRTRKEAEAEAKLARSVNCAEWCEDCCNAGEQS